MSNPLGIVLILVGVIFGAAAFYEINQPCLNTPFGLGNIQSCNQVLIETGVLGFLGLVFFIAGLVSSDQSANRGNQYSNAQPSNVPLHQPAPQPKSIFCSRCGQPMPEAVIFCPRCGNKNILTPT